MSNDKMQVVVIKNGIAKEVKVSDRLAKELEEAYDRSKVVGISYDTYVAMAEMLALRVADYRQAKGELAEDVEMFRETVAFSRAFEIYSNESPMMLNMMFWIERQAGRKDFSSKDISAKTLRYAIERAGQEYSYRLAAKDFKAWARELFHCQDLHVGFMKFLKFYYSVITVVA